jgi:ATP-dependent protease ClpP protease subunit
MMGRDTSEATERLVEIQSELLGEAESLIRSAAGDGGSMILARAEAYWLAHARMALIREHGYLGGSMVDMQDTIAELADLGDTSDEEHDEEEAYAPL